MAKPFLRWVGGKSRLLSELRPLLPEGDTLIEPFVGAGSVFLGTDYDHYILADLNADLINMYKAIQSDVDKYIAEAKVFFKEHPNDKDVYYVCRDLFNESDDPFMRSIMFLYLNIHCFNGLCRYNKQGGFNVPYGDRKVISLPENDLRAFAEKAQQAEFVHMGFEKTFLFAKAGCVVYCDPPYAPLSATSNFASYTCDGFTNEHQERLAQLAYATSLSGIPVVISNNDTEYTRALYEGAKFQTVEINRLIGAKASTRGKVGELFALYGVEPAPSFKPIW